MNIRTAVTVGVDAMHDTHLSRLQELFALSHHRRHKTLFPHEGCFSVVSPPRLGKEDRDAFAQEQYDNNTEARHAYMNETRRAHYK